MKKKGFVTLYILPIFLSVIVISSEVLEGVTSSYKLVNNYYGKILSKNLADIGLKHGIKVSKESIESREYYVSLVDNTIHVSDEAVGDKYTKVKITSKVGLEETTINIVSKSSFDTYVQTLNKSYIVSNEIENNIDNDGENLDTKENDNIT